VRSSGIPGSTAAPGHAAGSAAPTAPIEGVGGLLVVETESRSGKRAVGLPSPVVELLREHRAAQDAERELAGSEWQAGGWLFAQPNGKPTDPRADHREWKQLLRDAGMREARLHDARHTATMLLVLGVPQRVVMDLMSWSHTAMTLRYQHVSGQVRRDVAEQLGGLLWTEMRPRGR
jgi:integrase